ncbi:MAG TPA: CoA transferase, partial [Bacilli bacterium]
FAAFNRGKKSAQFDLQNPHDRKQVHKLALAADVIVENIRVGSLSKYGLGAEDLLKENPRLIYVSIRGYTEQSPRALDPGLEVILEAESGLMSITGPGEGGNPVRLGVAAIDMMTSMQAVGCVYSALYQREKSGRGGHFSVSLEETAALMMTHPWLMYLLGKTEYKPSGTEHPNIAPYEVFPTKDAPLMLGAIDDNQFARLARALNCEEWLSRPEWATNGSRVANRKSLHQAIARKLADNTAEHWRNLLAELKLPVGIVESVASAATKWANGNAPRLSAHHPTLGPIIWPVSPWRPQGGDIAPPPILGAATEEVLNDWLREKK